MQPIAYPEYCVKGIWSFSLGGVLISSEDNENSAEYSTRAKVLVEANFTPLPNQTTTFIIIYNSTIFRAIYVHISLK